MRQHVLLAERGTWSVAESNRILTTHGSVCCHSAARAGMICLLLPGHHLLAAHDLLDWLQQQRRQINKHKGGQI